MTAMAQRARRYALLVVLCLLGACSGAKFDALPAGSKVLVVGDSITAGYGLGVEHAWTVTLARSTGWQVVNAGVSGDTSDGGLVRLPALLDEYQPAAVIVELGGNDMLRRQSAATISANLDQMIELVQARRAQPILIAVPQPSVAGVFLSSLTDASFYAEIAKRKKIPLVENALSGTLSKAELKLDQLHPNDEGHRRIAADVLVALRKQGIAR